ncbi:MAG: hypothetical protein QM501_02025, partial [Gimesia sp.]
MLQFSDSASAEMNRSLLVKVRIEWGEQTARLWNAKFGLTDGKIKAAQSLGVDADEATVISRTGQEVLYQPSTKRVFNSIELQIEGDASTKLHVLVEDRNDSHISVKYQFALTDILKQKQILPVNQTNSQLIVQQAPGDSFVLKIQHPHLVFVPNELIKVLAFPKYLLGTDFPLEAKLNWTLYRSRSREAVSSGTSKI